jgi:hypothetical protein
MSKKSAQHNELRPTALGNRTLRLEPLEQRCLLAANFLGLSDAALAAFVKNLDADGSINRFDMIDILHKVQSETDGFVNTADLKDLRKIVQNASTLKMSNYVSVLAGDVVNGNTANAHYRGAALGNLVAGNSNAKLGKLIDKWFYGGDLPETGGYAYAATSGSLFTSAGPSHLDENQGSLGDCYLIAALGSIADSTQAAVKNTFIVNGDGTWTVRFYYNGKADYVTVNNKLPVAGNHLIFDGYGSDCSSTDNVLWLPLLEKAYTQWNETGRTLRGINYNDYLAIEGGWMGDVYQQVLGRSTVYAMSTSSSNAKTTLIGALNAHQAATIGTVYSPNFNNTGLYGNHAYNVVSYNASTAKFTLYNPWGCCQPKQLTWSQLLKNTDGFSTTSTTTSTALSAAGALRSTSIVVAPAATTAIALDAPASGVSLVPAAVDAALTDSDVLPYDARLPIASIHHSDNSWVSGVANSRNAESSGKVFADVDALFDSIQAQVALAV